MLRLPQGLFGRGVDRRQGGGVQLLLAFGARRRGHVHPQSPLHLAVQTEPLLYLRRKHHGQQGDQDRWHTWPRSLQATEQPGWAPSTGGSTTPCSGCQEAGLKGQTALPCPLGATRHAEQSRGSHTPLIPPPNHQPTAGQTLLLKNSPNRPLVVPSLHPHAPHQSMPPSSWLDDPNNLHWHSPFHAAPSGHYHTGSFKIQMRESKP